MDCQYTETRVFYMKVKAIIAVIVLVIGLPIATLITQATYKETVYPEAMRLLYVNDYAHVLSQDAEQFIVSQAKTLDKQTGAQVVVVTVPNTGTQSLEQYSLGLANEWGIGDKEKDNGILLLFTTEEPHVRLEVGKGLEGAIPDGKAGRILDTNAVRAKNNKHWDEAAVNTFIAIVNEIYTEYQIENEPLVYDKEFQIKVKDVTEADGVFPEPVHGHIAFFAAMLLSLSYFLPAYIALLYFLFIGLSGGAFYGGGRGGFGGGGFSGGFGGGSFGGGGASR